MVKISVIIPVYGVESYIKKCLESVVNQTLKDIEIIVVNDGTEDNSMKIVEKFLEDSRIKIIDKKNGGLSSARNKGLEIAEGEFVFFLDGDDWLEKEALELLYKDSENEDIIYSNFYYYNDINKKRKRNLFYFPFNINKVKKGKYYLCNGEEINVWNKLYRKKFLDEYNCKFIENIIYEDQDFGFKTMILANKIRYIPKYLYNYRINRNGSIMNSLKKEKELLAIKKIKKELKKFFQNIKLDDFQKARVNLKLISLELWEEEILKKDNNIVEEKLKEVKEIYINNNLTKLEKRVLKIDVIEILKKDIEKVNLFNIFYLKNGLLNFKIIKKKLKNMYKKTYKGKR